MYILFAGLAKTSTGVSYALKQLENKTGWILTLCSAQAFGVAINFIWKVTITHMPPVLSYVKHKAFQTDDQFDIRW